jgi:surface antigen
VVAGCIGSAFFALCVPEGYAIHAQSCDVPSSCTECILDLRTDILPFYGQNGWDISPQKHNKIVDNWCGIDPAGCGAAKTHCDSDCEMRNTYDFSGACPNPAGGNGVVDSWNFYQCECTSYVADKLNETGIPFTNQYLGIARWGHAYMWRDAARDLQADHPDKLRLVNDPVVGDIAWWDRGTSGWNQYGHVAYVVHAYPDNHVDVCEYNVSPPHDFGCRYHVAADGFIRFYTDSLTLGGVWDNQGNPTTAPSNTRRTETPLEPCKKRQAEKYWGLKGIHWAGNRGGSCNSGRVHIGGGEQGDLSEYRVFFPDTSWTHEFNVIGLPDDPKPVQVEVYVDSNRVGTVTWNDSEPRCNENEGGGSQKIQLGGYFGVHNVAFRFANDHNSCGGDWDDSCDRNFYFDFFKLATVGGSCGAGHSGCKWWHSGSLQHIIGRQDGYDWSASVGLDDAGFLVYGPYDGAFGEGSHTAWFYLMIDNNTANNDVVLTLDAVTNYGNTVLARREIRRKEFSGANTWQWFQLDFSNPCFGNLETRIYWHDKAFVKFGQLYICH